MFLLLAALHAELALADDGHDRDDDGHDSASYGGDDCDDADPLTYPGAPDDPTDGVVTDCDPAGEGDVDGDGTSATTDCDDADSSVYPSADEVWYDGIDQDCDGNDDDQDDDGFAQADDCDDTDATAFPGSFRWDENCDPRAAWAPPEAADAGDRPVTGGGGCSTTPPVGRGFSALIAGLAALIGRRRR